MCTTSQDSDGTIVALTKLSKLNRTCHSKETNIEADSGPNVITSHLEEV
jgi:hypothetical protein